MSDRDIVRELLSGAHAPKKANPDVGLVDGLLSGGQSVRAPVPGEMPAGGNAFPGQRPGMHAKAGALFRSSLPVDADTKIKRFAIARQRDPESPFHGMPLPQILRSYGVVRGEIVYIDPNTKQMVKEVPDVDFGKLARGGREGVTQLSNVAKNVISGGRDALSMGGAVVSGAATGPTPMSIPAAGLTAGGIDYGAQLLDRAIAQEPLSAASPLHSLKTAGINALGQGVGVGAVRSLQSVRNPLGVGPLDMPNLTPQQIQQWQQNRNLLASEGIDGTLPQVTQLNSMRHQQRVAGRWPETTDRMAAANEAQQAQVIEAIERKLAGLGTQPRGEQAVAAWRGKAEKLIDDAEQARTRAATPYYEEAFDSGVFPDMQAVIDHIEGAMEGYAKSSPAYGALRGLLDDISSADKSGIRVPDANYRVAHSAKENADNHLSKFVNADASSLKRAKRALTQAKNVLNAELKAAHPSYAQGSRIFRDMSVEVDALKAGGVGILKSKKGLDRVSLVQSIFSKSNMTPEEVARMRTAYRVGGYGDEWDSGVREYLYSQLDNAMGASEKNVAQAFHGRISHPQQKRIIEAAVGKNEINSAWAQGWDDLMRAINLVRKDLPEGSPTATDLPNMGTQMSGVRRVVGKAMSPGAYLNIGEEVSEGIATLQSPARRMKLVDHLLDSQKGIDALKKARALRPGSAAWMRSVITLLTDAGLIGGSKALLGHSDRKPAVLGVSR